MENFIPKIAIIDSNTLTAIGLKQLLNDIMPKMEVVCIGSFAELQVNHPEEFMHYFVSIRIVLENRPFFLDNRHKTIVLTLSNDFNSGLSDFHCICAAVPENILVKRLLALQQMGHSNGRNLPKEMRISSSQPLSDREIEVLSLVAQGMINKEIGVQLNISLSTVITHRKNIQDKLGIKSVSALTIYAVMHGYVDINKI